MHLPELRHLSVPGKCHRQYKGVVFTGELPQKMTIVDNGDMFPVKRVV
jgi:hypothetical protein